jgi:acyl-coenzyme A thioesterase PaaI-like protein
MADTTLFTPGGRQVNDLSPREVKERLQSLEGTLNTDRGQLDGVAALQTLGDAIATRNQAVTNNTAFDLFTFPLADEQGACWEVRVTGFVDDGTDHQQISLLFHVKAVNKGGTVSASVTEGIADVIAGAVGTLTLVGAAAEGAANIVDVSITLNSSLTPTTIQICWEARCIGSSDALANVGTKVNADA